MSQIILKHNARATRQLELNHFYLEVVPDHLKTQEMCGEAVRIEAILFWCVPDYFNTQHMCNQAVRNNPLLSFVPNQYITQEMCSEVVYSMPKAFCGILDHFKTQDMCKKAAEKDISVLKYVPDHFKTGLVCS